MEIKVNNIGLVKQANIKLDGLTIIAGENDTGKSTVGKAVFAIIKGMNSHHKDFKEDKFSQIEEIIDNIYFKFREISRDYNDNSSSFVSSRIYPPRVRKDVLRYLNLEDFEGLENYIYMYKERLEMEADFIELPKESYDELQPLLNAFERVIKNSKDPKRYIIRSMMLTLQSEFGNDLCNKYTKDISKISYEENGEALFEAELKKNKIEQASYSITPLEIEDATYIESPLIFQMHKVISDTKIFASKRRYINGKKANKTSIPFHMKDVISKMSDSTYYDLEWENDSNHFIEEITSIIEGKSVFDSDKDEFLFEREFGGEKYSFKTSNVASGIKSFSIIQMLLKAQVINERSILIIDEPEIHLHPKWQVRYCEIIAKLASLGVKILVNSHSPYIIQALKVLSNKFEIADKTQFYLAEKDDENKNTTIYNVNNDLNSVFKKLSDPLQKLVWEN